MIPSARSGWLNVDELTDELARHPAGTVRLGLAISGGGATGAYQAGFLGALLEALRKRGRPDLEPAIVVGTSAGALNAFTLLLDRLGLDGGPQPVPYPEHLWRVIAARDDGGKFVAGGRAPLLHVVTRYLLPIKLPPLVGTALAFALLAAVLSVAHPTVLGRIAGGVGLRGLAETIAASPVVASVAGAVVLAALLFGLALSVRRSALPNDALLGTLANAVAHDGRRPEREALLATTTPAERERAGRSVVTRYHADGPPRPEFILTSTDYTTHAECLFVLGSPDVWTRLLDEEWACALVVPEPEEDVPPHLPPGYAAPRGREGLAAMVTAKHLLRCVLASTSIPGVFPSQRLPFFRVTDGKPVTHDLADGGVLNNAPIHIAIDAGATHVISVELEPLFVPAPFAPSHPGERGAEPTLPDNLERAFATLLDLATSEDIRRAALANEHLRQAAAPPTASGKRVVPIFRAAPRERSLGLVDFDGHFAEPGGAANPSLGAWLARGRTDAARPLIWNATFDSAPAAAPPDA